MKESFVKSLTKDQVSKIFNDIFPNQIYVGTENSSNDFIAKYDESTDCLTVEAWDFPCFWNIQVKLYNEHFEIPKYKNGKSDIQGENQQDRYRKSMYEIYGEEYSDLVDVSSDNIFTK